jgi:hypothetical protein
MKLLRPRGTEGYVETLSDSPKMAAKPPCHTPNLRRFAKDGRYPTRHSGHLRQIDKTPDAHPAVVASRHRE